MTTPSDAVLGSQIDPNEALETLSSPPKSYTYYHAGGLFNIAELQNNVQLSNAIRKLSKGKYQPLLPQDIELRDTSPHSIRDQDIRTLLSCDLALFTYDGAELDSGTVVEYMIAKFADIPAVIVRSDFRGSGDQVDHQGDPWNLMTSHWPRTAKVIMNAIGEYKTGMAEATKAYGSGSSGDISAINHHAGARMIEVMATKVVEAFDQVLTIPARLPKDLRKPVYEWLALVAGFKGGSDEQNVAALLELLRTKEEKGVL